MPGAGAPFKPASPLLGSDAVRSMLMLAAGATLRAQTLPLACLLTMYTHRSPSLSPSCLLPCPHARLSLSRRWPDPM